MSALATYEIVGRTKAGRDVSIFVRSVATPPEESWLWMLREKYPSAAWAELKRPATLNYPVTAHGPTKVGDMATTPIRRTR